MIAAGVMPRTLLEAHHDDQQMLQEERQRLRVLGAAAAQVQKVLTAEQALKAQRVVREAGRRKR